LSPTARHGACLGLLFLVAAAFYAPVLLEGKTIHGGDVVSWRANAEALIEYQEQTGERALWAPNVFSGMPAYLINYGIVVPQLDTVVNALRSVMWPIQHVFLLMAGVYFLMVYLRRDSWAGLVAAVGFGFTTYIPIILGAGHQTKFVALSFAPFLLLAFVYTLRNPSVLGGLLFAGALSMELRAKHPQITYYVMMVLFVWWIVELVGAVRDDKTVPFAKATGWLAGGTGLGLLMVAQPYLATYQYKEFSTRAAEAAAGEGSGGAAMSWDYAMRWSQGIAESLTLVIADAFGGGQNYWGPKPFTEGPHYLGGVIVTLAGLALWKIRSRAVWGLGAAAGVTLLFAFGRHASWINQLMFDFFPFFDAFRAPETWLSITALVLAVLAGYGLDYALRRDPARGRKRQAPDSRLRPILLAFGVAIGLVALLWLTRDTMFDFERPNEEQRIVQAIQRQNPNLSAQNQRVQQAVRQEIQRRKDQRRANFATDAQRTLFFLVGAGLALVLYRRDTIPGWLAGLIVVGLVTVDLWSVDKRYLGGDDYASGGDAEQEIPTYAFDQFLLQQREQAGGAGHFRVLSLAEGNPTNTARPSYHYEQIGGYHGAKLQRYQDYLDHILQITQGAPNENALDLMNTRYIVARQPLPGTQVVHRSEQSGVLVLENTDAVPRAFFVGQTEVVDDARATWQRLRSADFDPQTTALLPDPLDAPITPIDSASTARVELQRHTPAEIEWTVETDAPRLLVASEVYYPAGWTAYLDGEPVPIHRVNYLLRGVHVPAGEHELVMRFEPSVDRIGTWIAAVATAVDYGGILWIAGVPYIRRRFLDGPTDEDESAADEER
jgi:hypothetical protein